MLGKAHVNFGFLASLALKMPVLNGPGIAVVLAINLAPNIIRFVVLAITVLLSVVWPAKTVLLLTPLAVLTGSLILDLDEPNAMLSRLIAPTEIVIRLLLASAGVVIVYYAWGKILMVLGFLFIIAGILSLKIIPMETIQRLILIVSGVLLIIWSYNQLVLALGVLYLLMGVLSHRGLTHSPEGMILSVLGAWLFTKHIGHHELLFPFAVCYFIHLVGDAFSDDGIFLSYLLGIKISIPLVKTEGSSGKIVSMVSFVALIVLFLERRDEVRFIYNFLTKLIK